MLLINECISICPITYTPASPWLSKPLHLLPYSCVSIQYVQPGATNHVFFLMLIAVVICVMIFLFYLCLRKMISQYCYIKDAHLVQHVMATWHFIWQCETVCHDFECYLEIWRKNAPRLISKYKFQSYCINQKLNDKDDRVLTQTTRNTFVFIYISLKTIIQTYNLLQKWIMENMNSQD